MQDNHLYEYAVIRVVPRVEREEFLNIGIILFCKKAKFIKVLFHLNKETVSKIKDIFKSIKSYRASKLMLLKYLVFKSLSSNSYLWQQLYLIPAPPAPVW